jgi:hypothetical protein
MKQNIWLKSLGQENQRMLLEMGNPIHAIERWQKQRILKSILPSVAVVIIYFLIPAWYFLALSPVTSIGYYYLQGNDIKNVYRQYKFERHLQFSKFTRLLIPYLKQKKDGGHLASVFSKIIRRLDDDKDKELLMQLSHKMSERPNDIEPFIEYAKESSGSDMSILFMSTLFDIKQGVTDLEVVAELDRLASEELMRGVDQIIEYKSRKFVFLPTKMTMSSFLLVMGFAAAVLVYHLQEINIAGLGGA